MQHQSSPRDIINVGANVQISLVVDINIVECDEDRRILPQLNILEFDSPALCECWLVWEMNIHHVKRCGKDMLVVLWISDPASLYSMTDCVFLHLSLEHEPPHIDISGGSSKVLAVALMKINVVEEYDDFGRGDKCTLTVDAHEERVIVTVAHVFTSEELQILRCKGEYMICTAVENAIAPCCDVVSGAGLSGVLQHQFVENVDIMINIQPTEAMRRQERATNG